MTRAAPWPALPDGLRRRRGGIVTVLGSANVDHVMRQDRLPRPGETIVGHRFERVPGGKGLNQAVAAARAGARVAFLGRVGDDDGGRQLAAVLRSEGIDTGRLTVDVGRPTGVANVSVLDNGENAIVVAAGANAAVEWHPLDHALLTEAVALVAQLERPEHLVRQALQEARRLGVTTVLTPAPVTPGARDLLPLVDVLLLNEHEARGLTHEDDPVQAACLLSRVPCLVVMTRGSDSSLVAHHGAVIHEEPSLPADVVDTTGAGDCFAGTFVARLAAGDLPASAIRSATVAASLSVGREGAASSMPTWAEVTAVRASGPQC